MNHGLGCRVNSCNRWFDKTIQFIIGPDGAVGANYEHCSAEGPPILAIKLAPDILRFAHVLKNCVPL